MNLRSPAIADEMSAAAMAERLSEDETFAAMVNTQLTGKQDSISGGQNTVYLRTTAGTGPLIATPAPMLGVITAVDQGGARTVLGLGSASTSDASAFATSGQGVKADSAVQTVNGKAGPAPVLNAGDVGAAPAAHVGTGGTAHAVATVSAAGFQSAADKAKLDGIAANATSNPVYNSAGVVTGIKQWLGQRVIASGTSSFTIDISSAGFSAQPVVQVQAIGPTTPPVAAIVTSRTATQITGSIYQASAGVNIVLGGNTGASLNLFTGGATLDILAIGV